MALSKTFFIRNEESAEIKVFSPLKGKLVCLSEVNDEVFSEGLVGDGCAVFPEEQLVKSPVDGIVKMVFPTKHALGLETKQGIEIMVHVGINTVELNGEGFKAFVKEGQKIKVGDPLIEFDSELLKNKGYDMTVIVVVTDGKDFPNINKFDEKKYKDMGILFCMLK